VTSIQEGSGVRNLNASEKDGAVGGRQAMDVDMQEYGDLANKTFPGLAMFVRDLNLRDTLASKYEKGMIIREKGITDTSCRVMGMTTTHRYSILSNHMRDFGPFERGTNWGLCVALADARFRVLDVYHYGNRTQILLLHLPENGDWKLYQNTAFNLEKDFTKTLRKRFENKCGEAPIPELATEEWLGRCASPLGMDDNGNFFELE
jgi:hypothetical protein